MMDIATTLSTLKAIAGIVRDAGRIDLTAQVIELHQTLVELVGKNSELATENADLRAKVAEVRALLQKRAEFYFDRNAYWQGEDEERDGPFCSRCFDVDGRAVRLTQNRSNVGVCGACKHQVRLDGPITPAPRRRTVIHPGWINSWRD